MVADVVLDGVLVAVAIELVVGAEWEVVALVLLVPAGLLMLRQQDC